MDFSRFNTPMFRRCIKSAGKLCIQHTQVPGSVDAVKPAGKLFMYSTHLGSVAAVMSVSKLFNKPRFSRDSKSIRYVR